MAAGIVEALRRFTTSAPKEPSKTGAEDTTLIKRLLLSLGMLAYESASEVGEVLEAMDAKEVVRGIRVKEVEGVVKEVLLVL